MINAAGLLSVILNCTVAVLVVGRSDTFREWSMPALHCNGSTGALYRHASVRNPPGSWLAAQGCSNISSRHRWRQHCSKAVMSTAGASGITGDSYTVSNADKKCFEDNG